jgi:2-haloacid dehalogenase
LHQRQSGLPHAVIFDVGNVLYDWNIRLLFEQLIDDSQELDFLLAHVVTLAWHGQHDAGRDFADTSAELIAAHPRFADAIAAYGPRFSETVPAMLPGMEAIVRRLSARGVALYAITNFSHEFWPPFREREAAIFDLFRDVVVSGEERMVKPDPRIYALALDRFGLAPGEAIFVDDRRDNVDAAAATGIHAHQFVDAPTLERELARHGLL